MGKKNKGKKKPLTGLAAALVKSGHLAEQKARKLTREQHRDDKALGRAGVTQREEQKQASTTAEKQAEAAASRERERSRLDAEAAERARRVIRDNRCPSGAGNRRWFFVGRDQRVGFLDLDGVTARLLGDGEAGIVESLGEGPAPFTVVNQRALTTLLGIDEGLVRFWNRASS